MPHPSACLTCPPRVAGRTYLLHALSDQPAGCLLNRSIQDNPKAGLPRIGFHQGHGSVVVDIGDVTGMLIPDRAGRHPAILWVLECRYTGCGHAHLGFSVTVVIGSRWRTSITATAKSTRAENTIPADRMKHRHSARPRLSWVMRDEHQNDLGLGCTRVPLHHSDRPPRGLRDGRARLVRAGGCVQDPIAEGNSWLRHSSRQSAPLAATGFPRAAYTISGRPSRSRSTTIGVELTSEW